MDESDVIRVQFYANEITTVAQSHSASSSRPSEGIEHYVPRFAASQNAGFDEYSELGVI